MNKVVLSYLKKELTFQLSKQEISMSKKAVAVPTSVIPATTPFNFNGSKVEVQIDENGKEWFNGNDVCECLGYKNPRDAIGRFTQEGDVVLRHTLTKSGKQKANFINESGVISLVIASQTVFSKKKELLEALGIKTDCIYFEKKRRLEFQAFDSMVSVMFDGYEILPQFTVGDYRIDFYVPELNLAIEIDEEAHKYQTQEDNKRQAYIENKIGCKFLRVKESKLKQ